MDKVLKLLAVLIGLVTLFFVSEYINFKENLLMSINLIIGNLILIGFAIYVLSEGKSSRSVKKNIN